MKPSFALNLSSEGIELLHRAIRGWLIVGQVSPDDPKLGASLAYLRKTALELDHRGLATKLILPEDQILYTKVTAPGRSEAQRRAQVAAALDGKTPYKLEEIVFDFSGEGPELKVAVVARATLDEAETFAAQYGFNPVAFAARPDPERFDGEPFFGETKASARTLSEGERVEREAEPLSIVGKAVLPRERAAQEPAGKESAAQEKPPSTPEPNAAEAEPPVSDSPSPKPSAPDPAPSGDASDGSSKAEAPADASKPADPPTQAKTEAGAEAKEQEPATDEGAGRLTFNSRRNAAEAPPIARPSDGTSGRDKPQSGTATNRSPEPTPAGSAPKTAPLSPGDQARPNVALTGAAAADTARSGAAKPAATQAPAAVAPKVAPKPDAPPTPDGKAAATPALKAPAQPEPSTKAPPKPPQTAAARPAGSEGAVKAPLTAPAKPLPDAAAKTPSSIKPPVPALKSAAPLPEETFGVFGAQAAAPSRNGRKIALLILGGSAAVLACLLVLWSVMVFSHREAQPGDVRTAAAAPAARTSAQPGVALPNIVAPNPLPNLAMPTAPAESAAPSGEVSSPAPAPEKQAAAEPQPPAQPQPAAQETAPGAAPAGDAPQLPSDPITRLVPANVRVQKAPAASRAPATSQLGKVALPARFAAPAAVANQPPASPAKRDHAYRAPINPPAYGTKFDLGPDGLVVPTSKGAATPDGTIVYTGRPPVVPPPRPGEPPASTAAPASAPVAAAQPAPAAASAPATPPSFPNASKLAVATSQVPPPRPADFSKIVAAALAASRQAAQPAAALPTDSGAVESQDSEPEPSSVAPRIPTSASVAKRATVKNAIRLNRLSLIGVFGADSNRQALMRTASGRIVKVKVGDRIDGGQIAAIGEHEVYYVKNGRNIRLAMPKG